MKRILLCVALASFSAGCAVEQASEEEVVGQTEQGLLACSNDVFSELQWNANVDGADTGWKSGCVSHRVELGLLDMDHPVTQQAVAQFPQYEGTYSQAKIDACKASYIEVWTGEKASASTASYSNLGYWYYYATPVTEIDPTTFALRIKSCRAKWIRGGGCSWNPPGNNDYVRVDVRAVPNGNTTSPGAATVWQSTVKDNFCGSL